MSKELTVLEMMQMMCLVASKPPIPVDLLFFHGRSEGDEQRPNWFGETAQLYRDGLVRRIVISNHNGDRVNGPGKAWPGYEVWAKKLKQMDVPFEGVLVDKIFTLAESRAHVKYAKGEALRTAMILTQPHQSLRAFLGLVKSIEVQKSDLLAWCCYPSDCDWWSPVLGSQSEKQIPRFDHIAEEYTRLDRDLKSGDLCTPDELRDYCQRRDEWVQLTMSARHQ